MPRTRDFEGATLDEALGRAAETFGVADTDLEFEVVEPGRPGLFGLGRRPTRIAVAVPKGARRRATASRPAKPAKPARPAEKAPASAEPAGEAPKSEKSRRRRRGRRRGRGRGEGAAKSAAAAEPKPAVRKAATDQRAPEPTAEAIRQVEQQVGRMVELMRLRLELRGEPVAGGVRLELTGDDVERLLERDAQVLSALQFVVNRMGRRAFPEAGRIAITCEGQPSGRDDEIVELAREVAGRVARSGNPERLHPMNAYERRLVHMVVRGMKGLATRSEGSGFRKRICIRPK